MLLLAAATAAAPPERPRARDLGVRLDGTPGPYNAITDVAGWFFLNGNGEMTGTTWVKESGQLEGPVMITNTLSVGIVHHAVVRWGVRRSVDDRGPGYSPWLAALPVVAETWDGGLNDILGQHVTERDALAALDDARSGPVPEGNVGGGTAWSATSSRAASAPPRAG